MILTLSFGVGWLFDAASVTVAISAVLLLGWHHYQQQRLSAWLERDDGSDAPESRGAWADIFDTLYRFQRRHRNKEANLQAIITRGQESTSALKDGVIMLNDAGCIEWWNRAAGRLIGLKRPQDVGNPLVNLIRDPRFVRYYEERQYKTPLELPSPNRRGILLHYTITEFGHNERLILIRDNTRLRRLERMRQDFVGNASHELRTPLTVISGYIETLQDQLSGQNPMLMRALQQMEQQADRMNTLVSDMLMLSRLETTERLPDVFPVDIGRLLRVIREDAVDLSADKPHDITLDIDERYWLMGEEKELMSAFSNLVVNAVKYSPQGGKIAICWQISENGACFSVKDSGIGIDPEHINRLSERFYRVDKGRSSALGGTGLGLAIVKHVMLRHGGKLEIESQPGLGSTFSCTFPAKLLQPASEQQPMRADNHR